MTLTLTLTLALALTNLTRWTSWRLEHQCGRPGPALGPGLTSPWAGPAAAARLWLLVIQGNCGVGAERGSVPLWRAACFRVRPGAATQYIAEHPEIIFGQHTKKDIICRQRVAEKKADQEISE